MSKSQSAKSNEESQYKEAISAIISKFNKSRITRFANSHKLTTEQIHTHNNVPVWFLIKKFKTENNIKTRSFKNLTDDQKQLWLQYYDSHKQLQLLSNDEHNNFHNLNIFDAKNGQWINNANIETNTEPVRQSKETKSSEKSDTQTKPISNNEQTNKSQTNNQPVYELPTVENTVKSVSKLSRRAPIKEITNQNNTAQTNTSEQTSSPKNKQSEMAKQDKPLKTIVQPKNKSSKASHSQEITNTKTIVKTKKPQRLSDTQNVKIKIVRPKTKSSAKQSSSNSASSEALDETHD